MCLFSSKQLERDPAETTANLLVALVSHFNGSGIPTRTILAPDHFAAPTSARATNALWFLALALALIVSLLAILAKQWINMFTSRMRSPVSDLRQWAHRHRAFRDGIDRWHLNAFITSISAVLHSAVVLFLIGLLVHLFARDIVIFGIVAGVTSMVVGFYLAATLAPLYDATCPTATPLLIYGRRMSRAVLHAFRLLFNLCIRSNPHRDREPEIEALSRRANKDSPPWDLDRILPHPDGAEGASRDVQILLRMATQLPTGSNVDVALDAIGGLSLATHRQYLHGVDLGPIRDLIRRRLNLFGTTAGAAMLDPAAVARLLRSSIVIESRSKSPPWAEFDNVALALTSIKTHDIFALSAALQLHFQQHRFQRLQQQQQQRLQQKQVQQYLQSLQQQQQLQEQEQELQEKQQQIQEMLQPLQLPQELQEQLQELQELRQALKLLRQAPQLKWQQEVQAFLQANNLLRQQQLKHLAFSVAEPIARWNLQAQSGSALRSAHPITLPVRAALLDKIVHAHLIDLDTQLIDLGLSATLMIAFGAEPSLCRMCHDFVTPLTVTTLNQALLGIPNCPTQGPLVSPADSRLRAIALWARIALNRTYLSAHEPIIDKVYSYLLTQWHDDADRFERLTMVELRGLVLSPAQLNLPATARATLCTITKSAPVAAESFDLHVGIVCDILQGVTLDEMVATSPNIAQTVSSIVRPWVAEQPVDDFTRISNVLEPHAPTTASGSTAPVSAWEIIRPYLVGSADVDLLAMFSARAAAMLSTRVQAGTNDGSHVAYERLLGGGVGRRLILSQDHRDLALEIARKTHLIATTWWEEMRGELSAIQVGGGSGQWQPTEGFEDGATFVRRVEDTA